MAHHTLLVEKVFETPEQHHQGLMYDYDPLRPNTVALFVFEIEKQVDAWMKNTPCALDIVFIKADNTVDHVHIGALPYDVSPISSQEPVKYMVEALTGYCKNKNIKPGDHIIFQSAHLAR